MQWDLTQDLQFLGICLRLDLGEASLPESRTWEIVAHARHLSSIRVLTYSQVSQLMGSLSWASGLIPLGRLYLRPLQRHFHSLGLTNRFTPLRRSDPLVLVNLLRHWQDLHFLTSGIPIRTFQADFTDASTQGWGAHMGNSQISGTWTRTDRKLHISCLKLKAVVSALQHWAPVLQGLQVMIATDNSRVVSYINKQGETHSPTLLRLTVELLLWLEAQNIIVRARHIPGCLNAGRWSSGGTFTSFHLRDLCPQAGNLQRGRTHSGSGGHREDLLLLARLESLFMYLFRLFFGGNLVVSFLS